jgi:mono/diheme cytochrome c family protein
MSTPERKSLLQHVGWRIALTIGLLILGVLLLSALMLALRFSTDRPVSYTDIEQHFKYGSTGGERESGFPYWIWQALPQVCATHLPGPGYASLGMIFEPDRKLPVGMSLRRHQGIDRTFFNCAVCHSSTVRDSAEAEPRVYTGMPANTFDIMAFEKFIFACGKDARFSKEFVVPEIARLKAQQGERLSLIDRYLVYPVAVWLMRERLLMLAGRFEWIEGQTEWGPGRVDTFNAAKVLFNFKVAQLPETQLNGAADFPSVWNQEPRKGMQLHWDGNNTAVEERNKSAAFGTGTTPPTLDRAAIGRIEDWLLTRDAPAYPYAIDDSLAQRGAEIYAKSCAECHGAGPRVFAGAQLGKVTPLEQIGTDRHRLDSYSYELAVTQSTLYAGYDWRFKHFRKTFGYANMPLDGLWLRAPYLHNGSVPTLRDLLENQPARPASFYRGDDVYDAQRVGFRSDRASGSERRFFLYDTALPGNSNAGHEGARYGTALAPSDKDALVEYLKRF